MKNYTVLKAFTLCPAQVALHVGDTLGRYDDHVVVAVGSDLLTSESLYAWVGSTSSEPYLSYTSTVVDPPYGGGGGGVPGPIPTQLDPDSEFSTLDIVNKINETIVAIGG